LNILCDTDVLSCFAKIKRLQLLKQLFPNAVFLISTAVYEELFRKYPFLTNDKIVKKFAKEYGVEAWDIPDILKALWVKGVKSKEEIKRIISEMERKDRMVIQDIWSK
jgi:predicted nucleic acid-binding protein